MRHEKRMDVLEHAMGSRFLQHRYRCEGCDQPEACARAELDKQLEEQGQ